MKRGPRKAIIHVDQKIIRQNLKTGETNPCITVLAGKQNIKVSQVEIYDKAGNRVGRFVYSPNKPLSCGARLWFELDLRNTTMVVDKRPVGQVEYGDDGSVVSNTLGGYC